MLKDLSNLRMPDRYFSGEAGFVASTLEKLHEDMREFELPASVPVTVRETHDAVRNAYIYAYYSYDLLTLAAAQTFPCLEFALRQRVGRQFEDRVHRNGRRRPPRLYELLDAARNDGLISGGTEGFVYLRNMYAHGGDTIVNPPLFLATFRQVTELIAELFACSDQSAPL